MKTVRIFISSPGDVAEERQRARDVVAQLQPRYAGRLALAPMLWEDLPLQADTSFQQGIDLVLSAERGIDVAVFILWSRLGSPLGSSVRRPDGGAYRSGTEREFDLMLRAHQQSGGTRPSLLFYVRHDDERFIERQRTTAPTEWEEMIHQRSLADGFIAENFRDAESGTNVRAYHSFNEPVSFALRLRVHLRQLLDDFVASDDQAVQVWDVSERGAPFRGLEVFDAAHTEVFFGREEEICSVQLALREQARAGCAFVLIVGASGSGKSSLARAGVLPAIANYEVGEGIAEWRRAVLVPGESMRAGGEGGLLAGLARALVAEGALPELLHREGALSELTKDLAVNPEMVFRLHLRDAFAAALGDRSGEVRLVLLVDQWEELHTHPAIDAAQREAFLRALEELARCGAVWVLGTVRSDFYAECQKSERLMRMKGTAGQADLLPARPDALRRIIAAPAALAGLRFERHAETGQTLDQRLLDDAAEHPEALPLLEFTLRELFEHRTPEGVLTWAEYNTLGGVQGALGQRAESTFLKLPVEAQGALDGVLRALVTLTEEDIGRAARARPALADVAATPERRALIEAFVTDRLFYTDREAGEARPVLTISHEALLRAWPRARDGIARNAEFFRTRARLREDARVWSGERESADYLLPPGKPLEDARALHAAYAADLTTAERRYIGQSIAHHDRERRRRRRRTQAVVAALALLALVAIANVIWAKQTQRGQRKLLESTSRFQQSAAEQHFRQGEWHEGVAYLGRALQLYPQNRAAAALLWETVVRDAPAQVHEPLGPALRHKHIVVGVDFSPDGSRIVTASWDQTAQVWDTHSGKPVGPPLLHDGRIWSASFSGDGSRVVTASADRTARVWDAQSGELRQKFQHDDEVNSAFFSPDSSRVVTACDDGSAQVWEVNTGAKVGPELRHLDHRSVNTATFSPDGARVVTAADDKFARIWEVETGHQVCALEHGDKVDMATFSPDGTRVVTASEDNTARIWNAQTGEPLSAPLDHHDRVNTASFSPDGCRVVTGSRNNTAQIWDASSGRLLTEPLKHAGWVNSARFSPDGSRVVTASADQTARIWDAQSGKFLGEPLRHNSEVQDARFSPDGSRVITASKDRTARVWNARTGAPPGELLRHKDKVATASFSADGTRVVTASWDKTARIWDAQSGESLGEELRHDGRVVSASFSADGSRVVTASSDRAAKVWDARSGAYLAGPLNHKGQLHSAQFSPDGSRVVTASADKTAQVWDAPTGKPLGKPLQHTAWVMDACFSPNGSRLVTACWDKTAQVWDLNTGAKVGDPFRHGGPVVSANFNPDGTRVITASQDTTARIWDVETNRQWGASLQHDGWVLSAKFNADGSRIVTASDDKTARVWDASNGKPLTEPLKHTGWVLDASFSLDGSRVVTASADRTAQVWDARTGKPLGDPLWHKGDVTSASFSPDGAHIITTSADNTARVWDARIGKPLRSGTSSRTAFDAPIPLPAADGVVRFCEALSGLRFSDVGELNPILADGRRQLLDQLREQRPTGDWWDTLRQWYFSPNRTVSPHSSQTMRVIAERERDHGTRESLRNALNADFTVPLANLLLASAMAREDEESSGRGVAIDSGRAPSEAFLRRFDLDRLAADTGKMKKEESAALWARAATVLLETPEAKVGVGPKPTTCREEALRAAQQAVALDPQLPAAQAALKKAAEQNR